MLRVALTTGNCGKLRDYITTLTVVSPMLTRYMPDSREIKDVPSEIFEETINSPDMVYMFTKVLVATNSLIPSCTQKI